MPSVEHRHSVGTLLNELVQVSTTRYCCAYKKIESGLLFVHTRTQLVSVLDEFSSWAVAEKIKVGLMSNPEDVCSFCCNHASNLRVDCEAIHSRVYHMCMCIHLGWGKEKASSKETTTWGSGYF
jgi:hypothetical protein